MALVLCCCGVLPASTAVIAASRSWTVACGRDFPKLIQRSSIRILRRPPRQRLPAQLRHLPGDRRIQLRGLDLPAPRNRRPDHRTVPPLAPPLGRPGDAHRHPRGPLYRRWAARPRRVRHGVRVPLRRLGPRLVRRPVAAVHRRIPRSGQPGRPGPATALAFRRGSQGHGRGRAHVTAD